MNNLMRPTNKLYTQWKQFEGRKPTRLNFEWHLCVWQGQEEFKLVSPIYRDNIYVNAYEDQARGFSPLDFFNINWSLYPLAGQVNFVNATLNAGDCMYIPAYYYVQSKSTGVGGLSSETIMIMEQYESHSKFIDVVMDGIEEERVASKESVKGLRG